MGGVYEVVSDREGGVTIEPSITPAAELHARRGTKPASAEDFERLSVDLPQAQSARHRARGLVLGDTQRTRSQPGWLAVTRSMLTATGRALPGRPFEQVREQFSLLDRIIEGVVGVG
jgi:hypothetical protein